MLRDALLFVFVLLVPQRPPLLSSLPPTLLSPDVLLPECDGNEKRLLLFLLETS